MNRLPMSMTVETADWPTAADRPLARSPGQQMTSLYAGSSGSSLAEHDGKSTSGSQTLPRPTELVHAVCYVCVPRTPEANSGTSE